MPDLRRVGPPTLNAPEAAAPHRSRSAGVAGRPPARRALAAGHRAARLAYAPERCGHGRAHVPGLEWVHDHDHDPRRRDLAGRHPRDCHGRRPVVLLRALGDAWASHAGRPRLPRRVPADRRGDRQPLDDADLPRQSGADPRGAAPAPARPQPGGAVAGRRSGVGPGDGADHRCGQPAVERRDPGRGAGVPGRRRPAVPLRGPLGSMERGARRHLDRRPLRLVMGACPSAAGSPADPNQPNTTNTTTTTTNTKKHPKESS